MESGCRHRFCERIVFDVLQACKRAYHGHCALNALTVNVCAELDHCMLNTSSLHRVHSDPHQRRVARHKRRQKLSSNHHTIIPLSTVLLLLRGISFFGVHRNNESPKRSGSSSPPVYSHRETLSSVWTTVARLRPTSPVAMIAMSHAYPFEAKRVSPTVDKQAVFSRPTS